LGGRKFAFEFTGSNAADVYWNYSDGNESFQAKPTYTFSADGTFKVMLVANNPPCKSDTIYFDVKVTNVGTRAQSLMNLSMMPNPASDQVLLKFNGVEASMQVMLVDALGREVYSQSHSAVNGNQGIVIPTANLAEGLYQVRIKSKEGISSLGLQIAH
jgi:PKD repeat protein